MRTAMITGASRGIGRAIAVELASQGYGLTITSRSENDLVEISAQLHAAGAAQVVHHAVDLADRTGLAALVRLHHDTYAAMDTLVLSGGIGTAGSFETLRASRIEKTTAVNFTSAVTIIQHALPLLRDAAAASKHGARVVILSSITGAYAQPGLAVYGATKAALISLCETLNAEESGNGLMATAVAPGYVDTEMSGWTTDTIPAASMIPVTDVVAVVRMILQLGRNTSIPRILLSRSGTPGYHA